MAEIQKRVIRTLLKIEKLTPDVLNIVDKDTFRSDFNGIRKQFQVMRKMLYDLSQIYTLLFEAKITRLKQIDKEVNKFKEDDKKIKKAIGDLLAQRLLVPLPR